MEGSSLSPEMRQKRSYFNGVPTRAPGNRCCDEVTEVCLAREDEMGPLSKSSFWEAKGWVWGWDEERKLTPTFFFFSFSSYWFSFFYLFPLTDPEHDEYVREQTHCREREMEGMSDRLSVTKANLYNFLILLSALPCGTRGICPTVLQL